MSFTQWVSEFKRRMGWSTARGSMKLLRMDYDDGMSPVEAVDRWRGTVPPKPLGFNLERLISTI